MADPTFTPQLDEDCYRFVEDTTQSESSIADYGEPAILRIGTAIYYMLIDDPDTEAAQVFRVDKIVEMTTNEPEEVDFEEEDDEEEEEEDETPAEIILPGDEEEEETEPVE